MKGIIEGLLYVQGDQGLTIEQVSDILEMTTEESKQLIFITKLIITYKWIFFVDMKSK